RSAVRLDIAQRLQQNFSLKAGSVEQRVQVTAEAGLVNTQSAELSEVVENRRVTTLPLNRRQFVQLILLTNGATPEPQGIFSAPFAVAGQSPNVNGNRSDANQY